MGKQIEVGKSLDKTRYLNILRQVRTLRQRQIRLWLKRVGSGSVSMMRACWSRVKGSLALLFLHFKGIFVAALGGQGSTRRQA